MSWTAPRVWSVGEIVTAANMNTYISNNLSFLGSTVGATVGTSQTTTSTSYADLGTVGPAVSVTTLTTALVMVTGSIGNSTNAAQGFMGFAVSGATTVAASDPLAVAFIAPTGTWNSQMGSTFYVSGLTAGSNTFTAKYRVTANTGTFASRYIAVIPLTT